MTKAQASTRQEEERAVGPADSATIDASSGRYGDLYLIWHKLQKHSVIDTKGHRRPLAKAAP